MKQYWTKEKIKSELIKSPKYDELKKRCEEAEGELAIIKGIGNKSPEMKSLKSEVEALKSQLALDREDAQIDILDQTKKYADNIFEKDRSL